MIIKLSPTSNAINDLPSDVNWKNPKITHPQQPCVLSYVSTLALLWTRNLILLITTVTRAEKTLRWVDACIRTAPT